MADAEIARRRWLVADVATPQAREALIAFPPVIRQLLFNRGIENPESADLFLNADERLHFSPSLIPDMDAAVDRVLQALTRGERIAVFGDFDADGVTATALLWEGLRSLDADARTYIPDRSEGHGLNAAALQQLAAQGCGLVISVDCGVSGVNDGGAVPEGMDLIITDHHLPGDTLPQAVAVVDPMRRDSRYPSPQLAGVGVAYKLIQGIYTALNRDASPNLVELVALGTIADVAPLVGENRHLVREGLTRMRETRRPGLRALAAVAGRALSRLTTEDIAFQLGPRINAAGRLSHAEEARNLLSTDDADEAREIAVRLDGLNQRRRAMTEDAYAAARNLLDEDAMTRPVIMIGAPDLPQAIVGLVAGRLSEEFYRPALVYAESEDGYVTGSARSIPEFDVTEALAQCQSLLTRFGGHHRAAGFTARLQDVNELKARLNELAEASLAGLDLRPALRLDAEGAPSVIAQQLMPMMRQLSPFGEGNAAPTFLARGLSVASSRTVGGGAHLRLTLREQRSGKNWDAIAFRMGEMEQLARNEVDVAFQLQVNNGGPRSGQDAPLELQVLDFRPAESPDTPYGNSTPDSQQARLMEI